MNTPEIPTLQLPQVNINGSSARSLLEDNREAWRALETAREALQKAMPNGRDYQTAEPGAYQAAREQHLARIAAVVKIQEELDVIGTHLSDFVS